MTDQIQIGERRVGAGQPVFVVAEAGVNHQGDPDLAARLIDAAVESRADAVKFQTFDPKQLASAGAPLAEYQAAGVTQKSQLDMLRSLVLPTGSLGRLIEHARKAGIEFLSTPFDEQSALLLADLGIRAYKVGSGDLTNTPLLRSLAERRRPLILSTGMATLADVDAAVGCIRMKNTVDLALLHCVSSYPAPPDEANLRAMDTLRKRFEVPVGWSDHCLGDEVALGAVARGASIVERHLTLDRSLPGPDHSISLEPRAFASFVTALRNVESALGDGVKRMQPSEQDVAIAARRSLVAARDMTAGETIDAASVAVKRPADGLPPSEFERVVGAKLALPIHRDEAFTDAHIQEAR